MTASSTFDPAVLNRVRELREARLSPKQIARMLGVRPAAIGPLVRAVAAQAAAAHREPALVGCWVSPGWSGGLTVPGRRDWPDVPVAAEGVAGMAAVVIARRHRSHRVCVCGYLVDTHCLGVKDTLGPRVLGDGELPGFLRVFFGAFEQAGPPLEAPLELARHLVWGAVDAARRLGFEPAPDFASTAEHLGPWAQDSAIRFGRDGMPYYVQGPYDGRSDADPDQDRRCGQLPLPPIGRHRTGPMTGHRRHHTLHNMRPSPGVQTFHICHRWRAHADANRVRFVCSGRRSLQAEMRTQSRTEESSS